MIIMNEEITEDPYDNNEQRNYKKNFMMTTVRRNYRRPL